MRYQIVSQTLNSDLFTVNDQTGQVYLRTNVLGNNINQYNVSFAEYISVFKRIIPLCKFSL